MDLGTEGVGLVMAEAEREGMDLVERDLEVAVGKDMGLDLAGWGWVDLGELQKEWRCLFQSRLCQLFCKQGSQLSM